MPLPRFVAPALPVFITRRTVCRFYLLRPDRELTEGFVYCLAYASEKFGIRVHAVCVISTHLHLVVRNRLFAKRHRDAARLGSRGLRRPDARLRAADEIARDVALPQSAQMPAPHRCRPTRRIFSARLAPAVRDWAARPCGLLGVVALFATMASGCDMPAEPVDGGEREPDAAQVDAGESQADAGSDAGTAAGDAGPQAGSPWTPQAWEDCEGGGRTLEAGPDDYRDVLDSLTAGDTLQLRPGNYARGLPLRVSGEAGRCIVIEPLDPGDRPVFLGSSSFNIVAVHGASWLKVRGLDIDGMGMAGFGVASQGGTSEPTHHVVIEDLSMQGLGGSQQIVGISTKSPAWDWVIRGNRIVGAGTGMYLGNSDGNQPFIRGVIEFNTVLDTIGYNAQVKHQNARPTLDGIPDDGSETIIRWNVFSKAAVVSGDGARPNLLLGALPQSGAGQNDRYLVYGNFFYDNPTEMLLQAEGNVAIYNNVFVNLNGGGIAIQPHNGVPRQIDIFWNTIVAEGRGVRVSGGDSGYTQRVRYNAVFGPEPISAPDESGNQVGDMAAASAAFDAPSAAVGEGLDLHPAAGALEVAVDLGELPEVASRATDFDGRERRATHAGAFAGPATTPVVALELAARAYR